MSGDGLFWELEDVHFPDPLSRWGHEFMVVRQSRVIQELCRERGLLLDGVRFREIEDAVYVSIVPVGGKARKLPPPFVMRIITKLHPEIRRRIRQQRADEAAGYFEKLVTRWVSTNEARWLAEGRDHLGEPLAQLSDQELVEVLERRFDWATAALKEHFHLHGAGISEIGRLARDLNRDHGMTTAEISGLFTGLSDATTGPAAAQAELAAVIVGAGGTQMLDRAETLDDVRAISADVRTLVDEYVDNWAQRAIRYEPAWPTIAEQPMWIIRLLREKVRIEGESDLAAAHDELRSETELRVLDALGDTPETQRRIARARRAFPVLEGNETATVGIPVAVVRQVGLEVGRRLARDGRLADAAHVFDLELDEAVGLLNGAQAHLSQTAAARYERRQTRTSTPAPTIGKSIPLPDLSSFPEDVADNLDAMLWYAAKLSSVTPHAPDADTVAADAHTNAGTVNGVAVSPGVRVGTARIVLDESQFDRIEPGDVLVCPITSPVWSMVFPMVSALVCDGGGPFSHPAIIAREFGYPAVVGTETATVDIADGAQIRVDGDAGTVTVLD